MFRIKTPIVKSSGWIRVEVVCRKSLIKKSRKGKNLFERFLLILCVLSNIWNIQLSPIEKKKNNLWMYKHLLKRAYLKIGSYLFACHFKAIAECYTGHSNHSVIKLWDLHCCGMRWQFFFFHIPVYIFCMPVHYFLSAAAREINGQFAIIGEVGLNGAPTHVCAEFCFILKAAVLWEMLFLCLDSGLV